MRDGPILYSYETDAAQHASQAACLREVQNLAAIRSGLVAGIPRDDDHIDRRRAVSDALDNARRAAERAGLDAADILAAEALGSAGVPWVQRPSHPLLGRIEQLTTPAANAATDNPAQVTGRDRPVRVGHLVEQLREQIEDLRRPHIRPGRHGHKPVTFRPAENLRTGEVITDAVDTAVTPDPGLRWEAPGVGAEDAAAGNREQSGPEVEP
ncbi:hypothetical protein IU500_18620 [Nocardia terpenica]|uniref:hypothetical protein n=1 Tax=Nocardia terpenica TaxID=455432 RepID=UPI001895FCFF|nr:hypothetical protein [Nocardia terpenica]MBF6063501.1 hypothetical protein [Nocardia terpenica]MBF6106057.1 hypothetical protein [Nocardia terpenica]MBF6113358.1 hypothetical protein [Nocardia terpenica]MBF6119798.1 hypothetical protein [Nocardia terpenica]MBF6152209.1 hypothetical protein [Nocardia terpenica]